MRVMAIDYGDAHTGVALSDPTGLLVGNTATINSWRQEVVLGRLLELIEEHRPDEVVLGFPKKMDATEAGRGPGGGNRNENNPLGRAAHHNRRPPDPF